MRDPKTPDQKCRIAHLR